MVCLNHKRPWLNLTEIFPVIWAWSWSWLKKKTLITIETRSFVTNNWIATKYFFFWVIDILIPSKDSGSFGGYNQLKDCMSPQTARPPSRFRVELFAQVWFTWIFSFQKKLKGRAKGKSLIDKILRKRTDQKREKNKESAKGNGLLSKFPFSGSS